MESDHYFLFFGIAFIGIVLFEYVACQGLWFPSYFRHGIPCFFWQFKLNGDSFQFHEKELEKSFEGNRNIIFPISSILFKKISQNECAFREDLWDISIYLSIFYGYLIYEPNQKKGCIWWKLKYSPLIGLLIILPIWEYINSNETSYFSGIGPTIFIFFFVIQAIRYLAVTKHIKNLLKYYDKHQLNS